MFKMTELILPDLTNHYGTLFAGNMIAMMVRAAFLAGTRYSAQKVVLVGSDQVECLVPVKQGSVVEVMGEVVHSGKSSLVIKVSLFAEGPVDRAKFLAGGGYFTLVSVDDDGQPVPIRLHTPISDFEKSEWKKVEVLKKFRSEFKQLS